MTREDLGSELKALRKRLDLTQDKMAVWLGISTQNPDGTYPPGGKAQVSHFEKGSRFPGDAVIKQYGEVPDTDTARLRRLVADARAEAETEAEPVAAPAAPAAPAQHRSRWVVPAVAAIGAAVVAAGIVIAVVEGGDDDAPPTAKPTVTPTGSVSTPPSRTASNVALTGASFVFDALGPQADQTIYVYAGPGSARGDKETDLSFRSGARAGIVCLAQGRRVTSNMQAGERYRTSDKWARIRTETGLVRYATMTYGRIVPGDAAVPMCG